jgi:diaminopimelate epimerase
MLVDLDDARPIGSAAVAALCDRRTGVGADGVIRVVRADRDDARFVMDYRNADGSPAEMCGNGARCVGKLVHDAKLTDELEFGVVTGGGVRTLHLLLDDGEVRRVAVEMGTPDFTKAAIPMRGPAWETFRGEPFDIGPGMTVKATALSLGNPHLVLFLEDDPDRVHVGHIGPALERHELFPERTNVDFAQVRGEEIKARVWERGSGETMACGSGACAIAVAANEAGLVPPRTIVRFPGGLVEVERRESGEVVLTGEATHVFDGFVDLDGLRGRAEA